MLKMIASAAAALVGLALVAQASTQPEGASASEAESTEESFVYVHLKTSEGDIYLELNKEKAPISTENFVQYTEDEAYDGTIFHRVIPGFMIQGGGFEPDMTQRKTREGIKNEWENGLKNEKYSIAMARLGGRPDSATTQWFINVKDNFFLDTPRDGAGYAVFGKVVKGFETVDKIEKVRTATKGGHQNVPVEPVIIEKATVLSAEKVEELELASEG
jgi:cyclophilin family peptidyl-prolyl cis-trans isomerase